MQVVGMIAGGALTDTIVSPIAAMVTGTITESIVAGVQPMVTNGLV